MTVKCRGLRFAGQGFILVDEDEYNAQQQQQEWLLQEDDNVSDNSSSSGSVGGGQLQSILSPIKLASPGFGFMKLGLVYGSFVCSSIVQFQDSLAIGSPVVIKLFLCLLVIYKSLMSKKNKKIRG